MLDSIDFNNPELINIIQKDNIQEFKNLINEEYLKKQNSNFFMPIVYAIEFSSINITKYLLENKISFDFILNGSSKLSYLLSRNVSLELLEFMKDMDEFNKERDSLPLDQLLENGTDFETFKFVVNNFGIKRYESARGVIEEVIDSEVIGDNVKIKIINFLINEHNYDINENEEVIDLASKLLGNNEFYLFEELVKLGLCVNKVAFALPEFFTEAKVKELVFYMKKYEINNINDCLCIYDFDTFERYLIGLDKVKDENFFIPIIINQFLNEKEKITLSQIILQKGANINEIVELDNPTNIFWQFITKYYKKENSFEYLQFLIKNGAKIEQEEQSALFSAVSNNDIELVKYLIENGANINFIDYNGATIINHILNPQSKYKNEDEQIQMFELLLNNKLDTELKTTFYINSSSNTTNLFEAIVNTQKEKLIEYILEKIPDIKINTTSVYIALSKKLSIDLLKKIVSKNPYMIFERWVFCPVRKQRFDSGLLELTLHHKNEELTNYLIDNYPDIKKDSEFYVLSLYAINKGFTLDTVKKLIDIDPDLNKIYYESPENSETNAKFTSVIGLLKNCAEVLNEDDKAMLLKQMIKNGADVSIPYKYLDDSKDAITELGSIAIHGIYCNKFEPKIMDVLLEQNQDPFEATSNQNESQLVTLLTRFYSVSDELGLKYLKYFDEKGFTIDFESESIDSRNILIGLSMVNKALCIKYLASKGAKINIVNEINGFTLLHYAVSHYDKLNPIKRAQTVNTLIELGCDIEKVDSNQYTALMYACQYASFEIVKTLLEASANVNFCNERGECAVTVVLNTIMTMHENSEESELYRSKILALLKDYGANLNYYSEHIYPILHQSILKNKKVIFNTLLNLDIDLNVLDSQGRTALMVAVAYANIYYVNALITKKVRIDLIDNDNKSIHFYVLNRNNTQESVMLLKYFLSQDIEIASGKDGFSLLHHIASDVKVELFSVIKPYITNMNIKDIRGFTPLHEVCYSNTYAYEKDRMKLLELFIENGADVNLRTVDGKNALILAMYKAHFDLQNRLIDLGTDIQVSISILKQLNDFDEEIEYLQSKLKPFS
ncbi:ankyrin repeat domain-containing protein [Arcobacter sp. CECT 8985]|uniref:ankyrin repeat domain-containing protein n=1 Tax=Arcobacter sp. CECT 8985 TaxID=1935424 RepID=UPI00100B0C6F|nr:ankyrin repeat domain-containing protein [Arcobacter sp. CECT 8985]RXJ88036.1 hypothetical protein CRU93_00095 [Arcobacter sp. CECT 8985]